ncbi:PREDICTED: LOB domain-containing protein 1-like isoform X2 [Lupinus angustifolius]|uniref:LOB domain-containing protein 1-like isoform X2 n=1 Tax=Lupinus angustifolius TaxID=3871 RepID=UPI00092F69BE|nr:PREDICTED: LOB domain-containing protein 1-like isoform X2 [Lupinus angustifolius]
MCSVQHQQHYHLYCILCFFMEHKVKKTTSLPPPNPILIPTMLSNSPPSSSSSPPFPSPSQSPPSPFPPPPSPPPSVVLSPCAACKILRRRCVEKCVLAPYFPPNDPIKFTIAHRVFGASNIIKFLQELPESQRADAVSSMVYEANARIRDPVYGCAGAICQLQKQVSELQVQLAKAQAELVNMHCQQTNLVALICMEMTQSQDQQLLQPQQHIDMNCFIDDNSLGCSWEPLWT